MKHTSSTNLRANLASMMDQVINDHEPVMITRAKGKPVVMISLEDYAAMDETTYLLSSPANKAALLKAVNESDPSKYIVKTIEELEAMEEA